MMWKTILINPLNPIVHFWLHHIAHCTEKMSQHTLVHKFWLRRKGGTGRWVGHPHCDMHIVSAVEGPWLEPGWPPLSLTAWTGLGIATPTLQGFGFCQGRLLGLWAGALQLRVLTPSVKHASHLGLGFTRVSWAHRLRQWAKIRISTRLAWRDNWMQNCGTGGRCLILEVSWSNCESWKVWSLT